MLSTKASLDAMIEEYRILTDRLGRLRDDLLSLSATEDSADGCARVTVNVWGELIRLKFDPTIAGRLDAPVLAERVEEAAEAAAAEVRRQKQRVMEELLPPDLRGLVDDYGAGCPRTLLGEDLASGLFGTYPARTLGEPR